MLYKPPIQDSNAELQFIMDVTILMYAVML